MQPVQLDDASEDITKVAPMQQSDQNHSNSASRAASRYNNSAAGIISPWTIQQ